jgi:hypothetical protein
LTTYSVIDGHANVRSGGNTIHPDPCGNMLASTDYVDSSFMVATPATSPPGTTLQAAMGMNHDHVWSSSTEGGYPTPNDSPGFAKRVYEAFDGGLTRQAPESSSTSRKAIMPKRKGRRHRGQTAQAGASEHLPNATLASKPSYDIRQSEKRFHCTAPSCVQSFKTAFDWKRHEAGVHGHSDWKWICMLTEVFKLQSECVFCLEPMSSIDHLSKHAITPCADKCIADRTFFRKDLLKQHISHVHLPGKPTSAKNNFEVPREWTMGVELSASGPNSCWCGFCECSFDTVTKRMDHVAQHFREGMSLTTWVRTCDTSS